LFFFLIETEMGHAMHELVSQTKYARFHGWRAPPDFAEMPSTFLENWCWMNDTLTHMSRHYTTLDPMFLEKWRSEHPGQEDPPEKIPHELVDNLTKRRYFNRGLYCLFQL